MARLVLSPGFRFHPTDVELVMYYLKRKILGKKFAFEVISELNICKFFPWDLPDKSSLRSNDLEWYFFCPRERKYASGARANRATENGYWKATGRDRSVFYNERNVGMVKTLVFYEGHAPNGKRTNWVIHEYRIDDSNLTDAGVTQADYVLCKVFEKSGLGPKNGSQYGAKFKEEDWDGDDDVDTSSQIFPLPVLLNNEKNSIVTSMVSPEGAHISTSFEQFPSTTVQHLDELPPSISDGVDIASLLSMFMEDNELLPTENFDFPSQERDNSLASSCLDGNDAYIGLGDLCHLGELNGSGFCFPQNNEAHYDPSHLCMNGDVPFLELSDLEIPLSDSIECNGSEGRLTNILNAQYNCYDLEQFSCGDAVQEIPSMSQSCVLHNSFHQQQDQITMLQKEADRRENMNQGNDSNSSNIDWTPTSQLLGSSHDFMYDKEGRFHNPL